MRVGIYIDGTWFLHHTARFSDPNRVDKFMVNWKGLPRILMELVLDKDCEDIPPVEVFYATSVRPGDTPENIEKKYRFIDVLEGFGYTARLHETSRVKNPRGEWYDQEKCVDMDVGCAAVSSAASDLIDLAILVTGDRDFEPAINYIRFHGKSVALVTSRESSYGPSKDLVDYKTIYVEDFRDAIRRHMAWCQCDDHLGPRWIYVDTQEQPEFDPDAFWCDNCRRRFGIMA